MQNAPIPSNEEERLASLHKLAILDTPPEEKFDKITRAATKIFNAPISTLTLVDKNREWYKSCQGLPDKEGDRAISFCGHALLSEDIFIIPDTLKDDRFKDNPMVTGSPFIRFYAGVPLRNKVDGQRIGVFCIKDTKPREFSPDQEELLKALASWSECEINSLNMDKYLIELQTLNNESERLNKMMVDRELKMIQLKKEIADLKKES